MTVYQLVPWSQVVRLHADVESGKTALATYAIDLGALVEGDPNVPLVYRDPYAFFAATHVTSGLYRLLADVLGGLAGGSGDRVLQLRSPFGGGKSHVLAALYHAVRERPALAGIPGAAQLPDPGPVRFAVFDGEKFGILGKTIRGQQVQTLWGALAAALDRYDVMAYYDRSRGAPGGDDIAALLGDAPTLILLDETLKYIERAGAEVIGDSTLGRQTQDFVQSLSTEAARHPRTVLVYSLQASAREAFDNVALLNMLDHLTSRVDAKREPVSGDEVLPVVRKRLLADAPEEATVIPVSDVYATEITKMRSAHALDDADRRAAEDDRIALRNRLAAAYPFHPALIDLMRERWASLPNFQRTRGALRFLSVCLHALKRENRAGALLGPGDIPVDDGDVAQAFFSEVGQREPFKAVLQRDFHGPNARVKRIDERLGRERPNLSGVNPAMRIATAILMYSFGGLSSANPEGGDPISTGVTESELLAAVVSPELDSITAQAVLKELREQCLYLHYDGAHYVFKTTPNVTQVLEDQANNVQPQEIERFIQDDLASRLSGRTSAILWPRRSQAIPDREPRFLLAYLPLDFAQQSDAAQDQQARELFSQYGDIPRRYRNGVGLAVPERSQVEPLRRAVRYLKAVELVRNRRTQLNLTSAQLEQLKERERTEKTQCEAAMRDLYQSVWLPLVGQGQIAVEKVVLSGRPLLAQTLHERLIELLTIVSPKRLFTSVTADKVVELMALGEGEGQQRAVAVSQVIESFYSVLDFPRLESEKAILRAVAGGVKDRQFGYIGPGRSTELTNLRERGGYLVNPRLVRIGVEVPQDEIDAGGAFLVIPQCIESEAPPELTSPESQRMPPGTGQPGPRPPEPAAPGSVIPNQPTTVRLPMRMNRQQLYASFNAIANLADKAGSIKVTVEAQKADGFDTNWLRNAVLEPLEEADVRIERD